MNMIGWYAAINDWADRLEKRLPRFVQYDYVGDPASWYFSHPAFCYAVALLGAAVAYVQGGDVANGMVAGAVVAALYYTCIREPLNALDHYKRVGWAGAFRRINPNPYCKGWQCGWLVDGVGDFVGCWLLCVLPLWLWLL